MNVAPSSIAPKFGDYAPIIRRATSCQGGGGTRRLLHGNRRANPRPTPSSPDGRPPRRGPRGRTGGRPGIFEGSLAHV